MIGNNRRLSPIALEVAWVVGGLFVGYAIGSIAVFLTGNLTPIEGLSGSHLGYDNFDRMLNGGGRLDISHPLYNFYTAFVSHILLRFFPLGAVLLSQCLLMSFLVAIAEGLQYWILRDFFNCSPRRSLILLGVSATSFTALTLAFTVESFTFSYALLSLFLFLVAYSEKYGSCHMLGRWFSMLTWFIGGVTITNVLKPLGAYFFSSTLPMHKRIRRLMPTIVVFALVVLAVVGVYAGVAWWRGEANNLPWRIAQEETFSFRAYHLSYILSYLSDPIMPRELAQIDFRGELVLRPLPFSLYWHLLPIVGYWILWVVGLVRARRSQLWGSVVAFALVDVAVHFFGGYGMQEAVIFGGHWLMLLPLGMAWVYRSTTPRIARRVDLVLALFLVLQGAHNLVQISRAWALF